MHRKLCCVHCALCIYISAKIAKNMHLWQIWAVCINRICNVAIGKVSNDKMQAVCSMQYAVYRMRHHLSSWASIMCLRAVPPCTSTCRQEISHGSEVKIFTRSAHWRKAIKKKSTLEKGNTKCTGEKQYKTSSLEKSYRSCAKHNLHISGLPHCWCWLSDRGK